MRACAEACGFSKSELIRIGAGQFAHRCQRARVRAVLQFGFRNVELAEIKRKADKPDQNDHR